MLKYSCKNFKFENSPICRGGYGRNIQSQSGQQKKYVTPAHGSPLPDYKTVANLDDLDRAIIEAQLEDPFFSYLELAEAWNVTGATIRNRIKRLKADGVIDVVTVINPYKVGYKTFAIIGIKIKSRCQSRSPRPGSPINAWRFRCDYGVGQL